MAKKTVQEVLNTVLASKRLIINGDTVQYKRSTYRGVVTGSCKAEVLGKPVVLYTVRWNSTGMIPLRWKDESGTGTKSGYLAKELVHTGAKKPAKPAITNPRYAKAKALLLENTDLIMARYYNSYMESVSLKVLWAGWGVKAKLARIREVNNDLTSLADYVNVSKGRSGRPSGYIYGFVRNASK